MPGRSRPISSRRNFAAEAPDRKWGADISDIWTAEGWLYLAVILDLCSRRVVGWATSDRLKRDLAIAALRRALATRNPPAGLLHHSDRGSQYCSVDYQALLRARGIRISMSGKGNCYDNAPMESFWGTLKTEHVFHRQYETRQQAMREITEYIEIFYNRQRRQKQLGYLASAVFERQFYELQLAA